MLTTCRHVLQAAQQPVDVDERQANAVSARIELDLRIGAALTRLQTLSLQSMGAELQDLMLSYGEFVRVCVCTANTPRVLPISHAGIRCRPVLSSPELCARDVLGNQGHASA